MAQSSSSSHACRQAASGHFRRVSAVAKHCLRFVEEHAPLLLGAAVVIFVIHFTFLALIDHYGLRTSLNDLAHMEQAIWQITRGNFSMPVSHPFFGSRLTTHANLIFYVLAPFYALIPRPETLLVLSVFSAAAGSVVLYLLARHILGSRAVALLFGVALLINPQVQELVLFDFHAHVLAIPLFLSALLAMEKQRWVRYWICIVLLLTVKEDMPLLVLFTAPLIAWRGHRRQALWTAALACAYFFGISALVRILFDWPPPNAQLMRFQELGSSQSDVVLNLFMRPWMLVTKLPERALRYLSLMFAEGGLLAVLHPPAALTAVPNLVQNAMDSSGFQHRVYGVYYSGIVITTLYSAAVYALHRLRSRSSGVFRAALVYFVVQAVWYSLLMSPAPYGYYAAAEDYMLTHNPQDFTALASHIPPDAPLSTQRSLGAHFARRDVIVEYPYATDQVEYIFFMAQFSHYRYAPRFMKAMETFTGHIQFYYRQQVLRAFDDPAFGVVAYRPPFYLLKRGHPRTLNSKARQHLLMDLERLDYDGETGINLRLLRQDGSKPQARREPPGTVPRGTTLPTS